MGINPFDSLIDPSKTNTHLGVPYTFSIEKDKYILATGEEFDSFRKMLDYIEVNIGSLSVGRKYHSSVMRSISKSMEDSMLDARLAVQRENAKIQREWDKNFNKEVLKLVRLAIEEGSATWHYTRPITRPIHTLSSTTATQLIVDREIVKVEIKYNPFMGEHEAYRDIREQAENAVRQSMGPPKLQPIP